MKMPNYFTTCRIAAITVAILSIGVLTARAAVYTYSSTLDLSSGTVYPDGSYVYDQFLFPGGQPTYSVVDGDTITGTITFANNQRLKILDPNGSYSEYMSFRFFPQGSSSSVFTSSVHLLGVTGNLTGSNPQSVGPSFGNTVIGATFFGMTPDEVSFSGFDYSVTLGSGNTGNNVYHAYDVEIHAAANSVEVVSGVPEPSRTLLLFGGLCGVASRRRRKRNAE